MKTLRKQLGCATFRTFVVDPPTMLAFAAASTLVILKIAKQEPKKIIFWTCAIFQLCFWVLGPMMYFDHPFFASQGLGNDFMWNGYLMGARVVPLSWIPTYKSEAMNFIAMVGWIVQPFCLFLGYKLASQWAKKKGWASATADIRHD